MIVTQNVSWKHAERVFREHGGLLRTKQALSLGIHPRTLSAMRDSGCIHRLSRGLYRLADLEPISNPDLVHVALKVPNAVVCLISALAFHELTTQVPHAVHLALARGSEPPRLDHPPLKIHWFSESAFAEGIDVYHIDGVPVRIYSAEKTIADCFKYRNKIGLDIALEALKRYREKGRMDALALLHCAKICRVDRILKPYLEALL